VCNAVLTAVSARAPEDLVSLRRRTRDVAEQFGLEDRLVQSFSAATYEAARLLFARGDSAAANISIGAHGDLEVTILVRDANHGPLAADLSESLERLNPLVERLSIVHEDGTTTVRLATALPAEQECRTTASRMTPAADVSRMAASEQAGSPAQLRGTIAELQAELNESNDAILRLCADVEAHAEQAREANRAKEDFLATLSHELRTPLNAMLGWTRLVRMGRLDPPSMARALDTIERNAHAQAQLIADILDVSRIVTGKLRLDLRPLDLEPVIDAAIDALRPAASAKGVELSCTLTRPGGVLGDPDRLQQVVWNLMSNAIKFTPAGGRVSLSVRRDGLNALITVTDTGEGMPAALVPFIFDRFRQGRGPTARGQGGLGLGLSIVRHIVELHGGDVRASSDGPGKGSTFRVTLPVRSGP
jgi:signal transduction histidine kinase